MLIGSTSTSTTGSTASADKQKIEKDMNQFLKLLVTQLQHQDPLQPMDANQFTQQLVQFASVEQQIAQNANLEQLVTMQKGALMGSAINYLGSMVEVGGSNMSLQAGNAAAMYTLPESAAKTTISVTDANGVRVLSLAGETSSGPHTFTWDGTTASGQTLPDGTYNFAVSATRADGSSIEVPTRVLGLVSGILTDGDEPMLVIGDEQVALSEVRSVNLPPSIPVSTSEP
jgi:Flagellar hook capping protein